MRSPVALRGLAVLAVWAVWGCARGEGPAPVAPAEADREAVEATRDSRLDGSYSLFFEWSVTEPGLRIRGQGVARVSPPYRARLDLFSRRGERVAVATLVNDELRLPRGTPALLPPPALLWSVLGVFRPGDGTTLAEGRRHGNGATELRYRLTGEEELRYLLEEARIHEVELKRNGRTREELRLVRRDEERFPVEAVYRHLSEVRELRINLERVEHVASHPPGIWNPGF